MTRGTFRCDSKARVGKTETVHLDAGQEPVSSRSETLVTFLDRWCDNISTEIPIRSQALCLTCVVHWVYVEFL